jgi:hypothetical protein
MQVVFRNENFTPQIESGERKKYAVKLKSVTKLAGKLQKKYPKLYAEVGAERVKQILKKALRGKKNNKINE